MTAYMKDVAPFLGLSAGERRVIQGDVWRRHPTPNESDILRAAATLRELAQREYHYAAAELLGHWQALLGPERLEMDVRTAVLHIPWWDTVDLLGSQVITPLVRRHPELVDVMWQWNASDDQWLVRAAIQHQRGLRSDTDVTLLLAMCAPHVTDRRFFVAKAVGWALRDTCRFDAPAVRGFVEEHPELAPVAKREAIRGLERADA